MRNIIFSILVFCVILCSGHQAFCARSVLDVYGFGFQSSGTYLSSPNRVNVNSGSFYVLSSSVAAPVSLGRSLYFIEDVPVIYEFLIYPPANSGSSSSLDVSNTVVITLRMEIEVEGDWEHIDSDISFTFNGVSGGVAYYSGSYDLPETLRELYLLFGIEYGDDLIEVPEIEHDLEGVVHLLEQLVALEEYRNDALELILAQGRNQFHFLERLSLFGEYQVALIGFACGVMLFFVFAYGMNLR